MPGGKYDREQKAQALAQIDMGRIPSHIAQDLGMGERTVQRLAKRSREVTPEQDDPKLVNEHYRLALRAAELTHEALDDLAENEENPRKYLVPLNVVLGTNSDKILRYKEAKRPEAQPHAGPLVIIMGVTRPEDASNIVEGEVIKVEEGVTDE